MAEPKRGKFAELDETGRWGWIIPDDSGPRVFAHRKNFSGSVPADMTQVVGRQVKFQMGVNPHNGKPCACKVELEETAPPPAQQQSQQWPPAGVLSQQPSGAAPSAAGPAAGGGAAAAAGRGPERPGPAAGAGAAAAAGRGDDTASGAADDRADVAGLVVLVCGIPGCGKDAIGRKVCAAFGSDAEVFSQDEKGDAARAKQHFERLLQTGKKFIFVLRNGYTPRDRKIYVDLATQRKYKVCAVYPQELGDETSKARLLVVSAAGCYLRLDSDGMGGHETLTLKPAQDGTVDMQMPLRVALAFALRFEAPSPEEGFDAVLPEQFLEEGCDVGVDPRLVAADFRVAPRFGMDPVPEPLADFTRDTLAKTQERLRPTLAARRPLDGLATQVEEFVKHVCRTLGLPGPATVQPSRGALRGRFNRAKDLDEDSQPVGNFGECRSYCNERLPPRDDGPAASNPGGYALHHIFVDDSNIWICMLSNFFNILLTVEQLRKLKIEEVTENVRGYKKLVLYVTGFADGIVGHEKLAWFLGFNEDYLPDRGTRIQLIHPSDDQDRKEWVGSDTLRTKDDLLGIAERWSQEATKPKIALSLAAPDFVHRLDNGQLFRMIAGDKWRHLPEDEQHERMRPGEPYVVGSDVEYLKSWREAGARTACVPRGRDLDGKFKEQGVDDCLQAGILGTLTKIALERNRNTSAVVRFQGRDYRPAELHRTLREVGVSGDAEVEVHRPPPVNIAPPAEHLVFYEESADATTHAAVTQPERLLVSVSAPKARPGKKMKVSLSPEATLGELAVLATINLHLGDCIDIITGDMNDNADKMTQCMRATSFRFCVEACVGFHVPVRIWSWPVSGTGDLSNTIKRLQADPHNRGLVHAFPLTPAVLCTPEEAFRKYKKRQEEERQARIMQSGGARPAK
eukprot:TRINITY_DN15647_c0_g1_i1.p1 TRINITY_DN15647_c0_g1~~TRINITY_DN15647_c0_g1_i1.p1  ORF type:complete len:910 (+),score=165.67 TRINITY_DN15647_c0_g1_i1:83-2812(+)